VVLLLARKLFVSEGNLPEIIPRHYTESVFATSGVLYPALAVYMLVILVAYALVFAAIQQRLPGRKITKGGLYGALFAGLWFFGFLELWLFYDAPLWGKVLSAFRDGITLITCGILVAFFWGTDTERISERSQREWLSIPIIGVCFAIGHGVQYALTFRAISTSYINAIHDPLDVVWLLSTGTWIGWMYYVLKPGLPSRTLGGHALFFAIIIFGINWALYNFFYNIFVNVPVQDVGIRVGLGVLGVGCGIILSQNVIRQPQP
jgi:hypothetical protein